MVCPGPRGPRRLCHAVSRGRGPDHRARRGERPGLCLRQHQVRRAAAGPLCRRLPTDRARPRLPTAKKRSSSTPGKGWSPVHSSSSPPAAPNASTTSPASSNAPASRRSAGPHPALLSTLNSQLSTLPPTSTFSIRSASLPRSTATPPSRSSGEAWPRREATTRSRPGRRASRSSSVRTRKTSARSRRPGSASASSSASAARRTWRVRSLARSRIPPRRPAAGRPPGASCPRAAARRPGPPTRS